MKSKILLILGISFILFILFGINIINWFIKNSFVFRDNHWGDRIEKVIKNENNEDYSIEELITIKALIYNNVEVSNYNSYLYYFFDKNKLVGAKYSIVINNWYSMSNDEREDKLNEIIIDLKNNLTKLYGEYIESPVMAVADVPQITYPFTLLEDTYKDREIKFVKWTYRNNDIYIRIYKGWFDTPIQIFYGNKNFYENFGSKVRDERDEKEEMEEENKNLKGL
jgi:hypothetical protein